MYMTSGIAVVKVLIRFGRLDRRGYMTNEKNQSVKADAGKPSLTRVPRQIIWDIAKVRDYGFEKYGEQGDHWDDVEIERWRDATYRHWLRYLDDPTGVDEESGISHLAHVACNIAFLCELEKRRRDSIEDSKAEC